MVAFWGIVAVGVPRRRPGLERFDPGIAATLEQMKRAQKIREEEQAKAALAGETVTSTVFV